MELWYVFFLSILYLIYCCVASFYLFVNYKRKKYNRFYYIVSLMYILIFYFIPFLTHFYVYLNGNREKIYAALDYSNDGVLIFYLFNLFSILGFFCLQLGYRTSRNKNSKKILFDKNRIFYKEWLLAGLIMFLIGVGSQFMWCKAYGGILNVLKYSSDLRSGNDIGIENSYSVLKRFVPLVQFANIIFIALWMRNKKIYILFFSLITLISSILYLLANDGRAPLVAHFLAIFSVIIFLNKKKQKIKIYKLVILMLFSLFIINNMDVLKEKVLFGSEIKISFDIFSILREEFAFTVRDAQAVILFLDDHPFSFRIFKELLSGILGILPSFFRPDSIEKLEILNTSYWVKNSPYQYYGGKPPEILSTGIYTFNYFGIVLLPFFYGKIIKKFDNYLIQQDKFSKEIFFSVSFYPIIRVIAYANFDGITLSFFFIGIGYLILYLIKKLNLIKN